MHLMQQAAAPDGCDQFKSGLVRCDFGRRSSVSAAVEPEAQRRVDGVPMRCIHGAQLHEADRSVHFVGRQYACRSPVAERGVCGLSGMSSRFG